MRTADILLVLATFLLLHFSSAATTTEDPDNVSTMVQFQTLAQNVADDDKRSLRAVNEDQNDEKKDEERGMINLSFLKNLVPGAKAAKAARLAKQVEEDKMFGVKIFFSQEDRYRIFYPKWKAKDITVEDAKEGMIRARVSKKRAGDFADEYRRFKVLVR